MLMRDDWLCGAKVAECGTKTRNCRATPFHLKHIEHVQIALSVYVHMACIPKI